MGNIYFNMLSSSIAPVCAKFDELCKRNNIKYIVVEDSPIKQTYSTNSPLSESSLYQLHKTANKATIIHNGNIITISELNQPRPSSYILSKADDSMYNKIVDSATVYMGERNRQALLDIFKGVSVPVRILSVAELWTNHSKHPYWNELGESRNQYVGQDLGFHPIIVNSIEEDKEYPNGIIIDGFKRLYAAHNHNKPAIECIDVKDVITEAQQILSEDQLKSPTRGHLRLQSAFPSSIGPSRSFGGVSGYNGQSKKKKHMKEYCIGQYGKITKDLLAHDNSTTIPAGSYVKVVDGDEGLPDVEFEGRIINVDRDVLNVVFKPDTFSKHLEIVLTDTSPSPTVIDSEFEKHIGEAFGTTMSIVEPDILATLVTKLSKEEKK